MADQKVFDTLNSGALWIQPGGPNTRPVYLGCHDLGDLAAPGGKITLVQCFNGKGGWDTVGFTRSAPEPVTFSLGTYLGKTADFIETLSCPATLFVHLRDCGKPDVFSNYVRTLIVDLANIATRTYAGLVDKGEDKTAMITADAEALPPIVRGFALTARRQSIIETAGLADIAVCDNGRCAGPCGGAINAGDVAFVAGLALNSSPANKAEAWFTADGGTWTAGAAEPFAGGVDLGNAGCYPVGRSSLRRLVTQGETVGGTPMRVAYSDDDGATWTVVTVGAVTGQFAADAGALFVLDTYNIWLVTSGGYVYYSGDGGLTWTAQESGVIAAGTYHAVDFADTDTGYAVGAANVVIKTIDGGQTWSAVTGPAIGIALTTVDVRDADHAWVGTAGGELWYTNDGGVTWTRRDFAGSGVGEVADVAFVDDNVAFMLHNTAAPLGGVFQTINGGYSWEAVSTPPNAGLSALGVVNAALAYAVGPVSGGTAMIIKVSGG